MAVQTRSTVSSFQVVWACAEPRVRPARLSVFVLLALASFLFFSRLPCALLEPEEARYAEIARAMFLEGRWLTPVWQGEDYLHKPPLFYWLMMVSYAVFGVHDWAARLVPCLAGIGTVLVVFLWARACLGRRAAWASALVLALSARFLYLQGMIVFDGLLSFWVTLALALGQRALGGRSWRWTAWLGSATACALGLLTKGPVAFALVSVPLLLLFWRRDGAKRSWRDVGLLGLAYAGALVLVAGPWFAYLAYEHPAAAAEFFWLHHLQRFVDPFDHAEPWWFFLPSIGVGMLPWSLWLAPACRRGFKGGWAGMRGRCTMFWLAALWCLLLFSVSGCKRAAYIIPALPPLAIALGYEVSRSRWLFPREGGLTRRGRGLFGGVLLALSAGAMLWLPAYHERFGLRAALQPVIDAEGEVFCFPRGWDSVSFYAGRMREYEVEEVDEMVRQLRGEKHAWVVVRRRDGLALLLSRLPAELEFLPSGAEHPNVAVGRVRRVGFQPARRCPRG